MALFNFGKKKQEPAPAPKVESEVLWSKTFTQSDSFRGYRRIRLSRYFHEEIDKNIVYFRDRDYDLKGRTIQLTCTRFDGTRKDGCRIDVRADAKLLGTVWQSDEQQWPMLTEYDFDKVHVRIEDAKVHLFVHYPAEAPVKVSTRVE